MKPLSVFCLLFLLSAGLLDAAGTKKVLFFSKSSGHEHSVIKRTNDSPSHAEKVLQQLGKKHDIEFHFTKNGREITATNLDRFDAIFFYTTGDLTTPGTDKNPPMTAGGKEELLQAIKAGKGFIGTHSATDTFHSPGTDKNSPQRYQADAEKTDPYIRMIGAEFIRHGKQQRSRMIQVDTNFPGMRGMPADFGPMEEWYSLKNFASDMHVVLLQDTSTMQSENMYRRPPYPVTWARLHGKGRVFYTSLGHREDIWTNPVFQDLLMGGINWAVGRTEADVTPNLKTAAPGADVLPPAPANKTSSAAP
jgi:hypothetical protein